MSHLCWYIYKKKTKTERTKILSHTVIKWFFQVAKRSIRGYFPWLSIQFTTIRNVHIVVSDNINTQIRRFA